MIVNLCINGSDVRFQPADIAWLMKLGRKKLMNSFLFLSHPAYVSANIFLNALVYRQACTSSEKWLYSNALYMFTVFAAEELDPHTVSQSTPRQGKNTNILSFYSWKPVSHYCVTVLVTCKVLKKKKKHKTGCKVVPFDSLSKVSMYLAQKD